MLSRVKTKNFEISKKSSDWPEAFFRKSTLSVFRHDHIKCVWPLIPSGIAFFGITYCLSMSLFKT